MKIHQLWITLILLQGTAFSQTALDNCADQFIDSNVANAPTVFNSPPDQPFGSNVHLCYRDDGVSFFASEYWPGQFAPRWAAYKLTPGNYGTDGCSTFTRDGANCYFRKDTWAEVLSCDDEDDPFHGDHMLTGTKLGTGDFSNTGHDRGHIAPRQAFSWHVCGTYQTFSMANMSPQRAFLNQNIWQELEKQVLTWAVDEGPIYVVTGTAFRRFPHERFDVFSGSRLNPNQIYSTSATMLPTVQQHRTNHSSTASGDILRPKRTANPDSVRDRVKDMRMPTGYFKVIYRPAVGSEPAHAIGFLLPHTFENLNKVADFFPNVTTARAFWVFVSRIDLIEETSGITFPGIPAAMKPIWGDDWFSARNVSRNIRSSTCGRGTPDFAKVNVTRIGDE